MNATLVRGALAALVVGTAHLSAAQTPAAGDPAVLQAFHGRIAAYVELHRRLEGPLPTLEASDDLAKVHVAMAALGQQIRRARRTARQGDILTPDVARLIRDCVADCMPHDQLQALLEEDDDHAPARPVRLRVNGGWPPDAPFTYVPPQLLQLMPPLPSELQYRIIGRDLVLWDHHANLIVDFLPGVFAGG